MSQYSFDERLNFSRGVRETDDMSFLRQAFCDCKSVEKTTEQTDKTGVDYIVTLRKGAQVFVDAKARSGGCGKFWRNGPELALETWSVKASNQQTGKTGWTLSESSLVDYILFTFDPGDTKQAFLYPFQILRIAFRCNLADWQRKYKTGQQTSESWGSECVFVPESIVFDAMAQVMRR